MILYMNREKDRSVFTGSSMMFSIYFPGFSLIWALLHNHSAAVRRFCIPRAGDQKMIQKRSDVLPIKNYAMCWRIIIRCGSPY